MSAIINLFKKIKRDKKFANTGSGQTLGNKKSEEEIKHDQLQRLEQMQQRSLKGAARKGNDKNVSVDERQMAADAALARLQIKKTRGIPTTSGGYSQQQQQLHDKETLIKAQKLAAKFSEKSIIDFDTPTALKEVLFTCDFLEDSPFSGPYNASDMKKQLVLFFYDNCLDEDLRIPSILMIIYVANSPALCSSVERAPPALRKGLDTMKLLVTNFYNNPEDVKFRRIRLKNIRIADEVLSLVGAIDLFKFVGFQDQFDEDSNENILIINEDKILEAKERAGSLLNLMEDDMSFPVYKVFRNTKVFQLKENISLSKVDLPSEFYAISDEDIKKEMAVMQETIEQLGMLQTKLMRERFAQKEMRRYRYCLIRVRFPDGYVVQSTFKATEKFSCLCEWLSDCLRFPHLQYNLHAAGLGKINDSHASLAELKLTPMSLLNFNYNKEESQSFVALGMSGGKEIYLSDVILSNAPL